MAYIADTDFYAFSGISATDATVSFDEVTLIIERSQKFIEEYTGRVFDDSAGASTRYYTYKDDVEDMTLFLDKDLLELGTDSIVAGTDAIASTDVVFEPRNDKPYYGITLKQEATQVWTDATSDGDYENAIQVHGIWSYSSDVPNDIKYACLLMARYMFNRSRLTDVTADRPIVLESGAVIQAADFPRDILAILDHYKRMEIVS
jgi:hypothetical protein